MSHVYWNNKPYGPGNLGQSVYKMRWVSGTSLLWSWKKNSHTCCKQWHLFSATWPPMLSQKLFTQLTCKWSTQLLVLTVRAAMQPTLLQCCCLLQHHLLKKSVQDGAVLQCCTCNHHPVGWLLPESPGTICQVSEVDCKNHQWLSCHQLRNPVLHLGAEICNRNFNSTTCHG